MAYATEHLAHSGVTFGTRFRTLRTTLATRIAQYRVYRETINDLSDLTDRELEDLGVSRASIRRIAQKAAYGA